MVLVNALGGFQYLFYKMNNRGLTGIYEHRKNLFEVMPIKDEGEIIFLGNSLTAYCEWGELFGDPKIINRGIPGDHIFGILERIEEIEERKPRKIFLMIGVNDLLFHEAETVIKYYEELLKQMVPRFTNTEIYVQSLLPINNEVKQTTIDNRDIIKINQAIEKLADSKELIFLNLFPHFLNKAGNLDEKYTQDGIHLNGTAYLVWKKAIEQYVLEE